MGHEKIIFCFGIFILFFSLVAGAEIGSSCQNYPPPDFCPNGSIIANGTDANGCTIWGCEEVENITSHYIVLDENPLSQDVVTAIELKNFLEELLGENFSFEIKYNNDILRSNLSERVTVFIYKNKSLVINNEIDYGIIISNHPTPGSPDKGAITTYFEISEVSYLVIPRDGSDVEYDDLILELYKGCKNAGDYWLVKPSTRYNICCEDLDFVAVASEFEGGLCSFDQEHLMCSDCGNDFCEEWENICNCPNDCEEEIQNNESNENENNGEIQNNESEDLELEEQEESKNVFGRFFRWVGRIFGRR